MGYRSNVVIAINKDLLKSEPNILGDLSDCDQIHQSDDVYYFEYHSVKWYPEYEAVRRITEFVQENSNSASMVRLGEEFDDVEGIGDYIDHGLTVQRSIDLPFVEPVKFKNLKLLFFKKDE